MWCYSEGGAGLMFALFSVLFGVKCCLDIGENIVVGICVTLGISWVAVMNDSKCVSAASFVVTRPSVSARGICLCRHVQRHFFGWIWYWY